jgi:hypothetical protein
MSSFRLHQSIANTFLRDEVYHSLEEEIEALTLTHIQPLKTPRNYQIILLMLSQPINYALLTSESRILISDYV